jgi:tRNA threonylcarbamoyladenosine biosynthesis protein TsaE
MNQEYTITSVEEMDVLAQEMANRLQGGEVLALYGDLGAGKTTFTQFLARHLGVQQTVVSPTFVIERQYAAKDKTLHHFDWYRLDSSQAVTNLGIDELFEDSGAIVVIEWPERAEDLLPNHTWKIRLHVLDEQHRQVSIETP